MIGGLLYRWRMHRLANRLLMDRCENCNRFFSPIRTGDNLCPVCEQI